MLNVGCEQLKLKCHWPFKHNCFKIATNQFFGEKAAVARSLAQTNGMTAVNGYLIEVKN